jgi:hypothetical protein
MRTGRVFLLMITGLVSVAPQYLHAQKNLTKTVVDARTRLPIDYVFVKSNDDNIRLMTNKGGRFILIDNLSATSFVFYKMGYRQQR